MYRAAIIGCGKIGSEFSDLSRQEGIFTHADAYQACQNTELVALCDVDLRKLKKCGKKRGIRALYNNPEELLSEQKPDILSICTPAHTHYPLVRTALESKAVRAVIAEKPLAIRVSDAEALVQLAARNKKVLAVNYQRRYLPCFIGLRELIRDGGLGRIQTVGGFYSKGLIHNGTHWLDLIRFLVGEPKEVQGIDLLGENGEDPTLDLVLKFVDGTGGHLQACRAEAFGIFEMDIVGTKKRVRLSDGGNNWEWSTVGEHPRFKGVKALLPSNGLPGTVKDALLYVVKNTIDCLETGRSPQCSGEDAVAALRIAMIARKSARGRF